MIRLDPKVDNMIKLMSYLGRALPFSVDKIYKLSISNNTMIRVELTNGEVYYIDTYKLK